MSTDDFTSRLRVSRWGVLLALFTVFFGFCLGGAFGAFEDALKKDLTARAAAVLDSAYGGDTAKAKSTVDKSWSYYKRSHLHGGAIGTAALGGILLLAALRRPSDLVRRGVSIALGGGALGYSAFWLLAGHAAPGLGGTGAAKDALEWLAVPSSGLVLLGFGAVIVLAAIEFFAPSRAPQA